MLKAFATVFVTVFLAEIGDKTQLATMLFASERDVNRWLVFAGASRSALLIIV
jgi:putative Ca2+/H+ antiporter (TMEM165/GDT1 family)